MFVFPPSIEALIFGLNRLQEKINREAEDDGPCDVEIVDYRCALSTRIPATWETRGSNFASKASIPTARSRIAATTSGARCGEEGKSPASVRRAP